MNPLVIAEYFTDLPDPRVERTRRHNLLDIVVISVLAVVCGANTWSDIAGFAVTRERFLCGLLRLPSGIPSENTFRRVFTALDVDQFERCFIEWTRDLAGTLQETVIAIDGKTLRSSFTTSHRQDARHIVSAWSATNRLVLGQVTTEEKSNEITATPRLLELLNVQGATITIDAMGYQRADCGQDSGPGRRLRIGCEGQPAQARRGRGGGVPRR